MSSFVGISDEGGGFFPFPPFYSSGLFVYSTPLFFTPTILLAFVVLVGSLRYFLQTKNVPWQDISSPLISPDRRLSPLSRLIVVLSCAVTSSFFFDGLVVIVRVLLDQGSLSVMLVYYIGISWLAWVISLACLLDESHKFSKWYWLQYTYFAMAAAGETLVAWLWLMGIYKPRPGKRNSLLNDLGSEKWVTKRTKLIYTGSIFTIYDYILLGIFIARYVLEIITFTLSIIQMITTIRHIERNNREIEPLLASTSNYGATTTAADTNSNNPITTSSNKKKDRKDFLKKLAKVMPFIWPHNNTYLQSLVLICFILMCIGLAINVFTPLQIGTIVDRFNKDPQSFAWAAVLAYVAFKFLQGGSGLIQAVQNWLWIPIGQYTTREISVKLFAHLHSLSLHYHINRKTGEVLRIVDRGTNSIVQLLSQIVFSIFPALANILIAVVVFSVKFSLPFGIITFVTMALYLYTTITLTEWRTAFRRKMNELDNFARTKAVDSLLNFETVKYYNAEGFEVDRYDKAIVEYQKADYINSVSLNVLNLAQNAVITGGLLAASLLFAWEVSKGRLTAGNFVTFNVYMMQLYTPLHFFGTYYRMIQQNFIDMEKMFDLFEVEETVKDVEGAGDLNVTEGRVVFDNVSFAYDNRQTALNGISFSIPKGSQVALVGPSGGGKSTILRLLFRFYDPLSGHIYIDGQDISSVKQSSLRKNIGVVPQDTVLFNDTILYNIRYGDVTASDEDVYRAAKAAQIHDKILSFPDGYETKVGERGLRLSGGEKQRVAIARTILKNPPIILLDEATSALDTTTERHIQEALGQMTKDRTTLIIAHRLSTIVNSDLILVVKDGKVVEAGSHDELISSALAGQNEGIYYEMWQKQLDDHHDTSQTASGVMTPKQLVVGDSGSLPIVTVDEPTSIGCDEQEEQAKEAEPAPAPAVNNESTTNTTAAQQEETRPTIVAEEVAKAEELKQQLEDQVEAKEIQDQEEAQGLKITTAETELKEDEEEESGASSTPTTSQQLAASNNNSKPKNNRNKKKKNKRNSRK